MNFKGIKIASFNKKSLIGIAALLIDKLNVLPTLFSYLQWYICCQNVIGSKLYKTKITTPERKPPENFYSVQFHNKAVEQII